MPTNTCTTCGKQITGACPTCAGIAARQHVNRATVVTSASDGAFREGLPPLHPDPLPSIRIDYSIALVRLFPYFLVVAMSATAFGLLLCTPRRTQCIGASPQRLFDVKGILLACHSYHDVHKVFPTPKMVVTQAGKEQTLDLSWRVAILPYVDQNIMFKALDRGVGWDHPNNVNFQNQIPGIYHDPRDPVVAPKVTRYQYFTGKRTLFPDNTAIKVQEIKDGSSFTMLLAEAVDVVVWTQPKDMEIRRFEPLPLPKDRFLAGFADGSARRIARVNTSNAILRQLIDPNDQGPGADWEQAGR